MGTGLKGLGSVTSFGATVPCGLRFAAGVKPESIEYIANIKDRTVCKMCAWLFTRIWRSQTERKSSQLDGSQIRWPLTYSKATVPSYTLISIIAYFKEFVYQMENMQ